MRKKKTDKLLRQIDQDIRRLEKRADDLKAAHEKAQGEYQKAVDELRQAVGYRNYRISQIETGRKGQGDTKAPAKLVFGVGTWDQTSVKRHNIGNRQSPVRDSIIKLFRDRGGPVTRKEILDYMKKGNPKFGDNNLWMALSRMQMQGMVRRVKAGTYELIGK